MPSEADCKTTGSSKALQARLAKLRKKCKDVQKAGQLKTDTARKAEITRVCKSCNKPKRHSSGKAPDSISTDIKVKLAENCDKNANSPPRLTVAELRELLGANVVKGKYKKNVKLACDRKIKPTKKIRVVGSKEEVFYGYAQKTAGGLKKKDVKWNNANTKIVSAKASAAALKRGVAYKKEHGVSQMVALKVMADESREAAKTKKKTTRKKTAPKKAAPKKKATEKQRKDAAAKRKAAKQKKATEKKRKDTAAKAAKQKKATEKKSKDAKRKKAARKSKK